jgi:ribulose-5-phosphate 4-epimerase/fuculose-1-phosphate aldolase
MSTNTIYWEKTEREDTARKADAAPMSEAEWQARVKLAAAYRIFAHLGWTELIFNHITLRVPGPEKLFLINPFGLHYSEVRASNLLLVDIDGNPVRAAQHPVNRAGFMIHSAIHESVAEAHCVMHTHTTNGMAVACLAEGLSPTNFYAAQLHGQVAYHEFEGVTVEPGEKPRLLASIGDKRAVILRNHGLLTWGPTVDQAFMLMWTLQRACDVQVTAAAAGTLHAIQPQVFEQTVRMGGPAEKRLTEDVFAAMQRMVDKIDPSYRN